MITHDPQQHRFSLEKDGHQARVDYTLSGKVMIITHTLVPEAIGGQGIAGQLNQAALEHALAAGWSVIPACSYTRSYIDRHPRFQDLVKE